MTQNCIIEGQGAYVSPGTLCYCFQSQHNYYIEKIYNFTIVLLIIVYIIPCSSIEQKYALWSFFICPVWLVSFYMEHMSSQNRLDLDKWPCLWIRTAQFCSGQKFELREIWRVVAEKIVHSCIEPFHLNLQEPVVFG